MTRLLPFGPAASAGWSAIQQAASDQPGQAGPLALFVMLVLALVTLLLVRSMRQHLRRVPPSFDPPEGTRPGGEPGDDPFDGSADPSRR